LGKRRVILLDTHVWIWWVHGDPQLPPKYRAALEAAEAEGFGVSVISCWEAAKLVEVGRLKLPKETLAWMESALAYPGIRLLELTPAMAVASTQLPSPFHRDPADQLLVATSTVLQIPIMTLDSKILSYPHVNVVQV
jgi:PIN domain nuclease of toxin-antitoxin system